MKLVIEADAGVEWTCKQRPPGVLIDLKEKCVEGVKESIIG